MNKPQKESTPRPGKEDPEPGIPNPDEILDNDQAARKHIAAVTLIQKKMEAERKAVPEAAEPKEPHLAETPKKTADAQAKVLKAQGSTVPQYGIRPQPPTKIKEEGSVIVAKALSEQLGTSPEIKAEQRIDERKMAVLDDVTLAALSHFSYRYTYDGVRYWGHITEWWLTGSQGIGGLGRRHILQALANTSGVQSVDKAKSPNVIARNVWDRNWKEKAESEGKVVEE